MKNEVVLLPLFQEKIRDKKYRSHLDIIQRMISKLEAMGKNALKILDVQDNLLLGEMKVKRPPYRLYVIVDQNTSRYYVADWDHKEKQDKIIRQLRLMLSKSIDQVLDRIFT